MSSLRTPRDPKSAQMQLLKEEMASNRDAEPMVNQVLSQATKSSVTCIQSPKHEY